MPVAHSLHWFFTEGIYRPDWLQAGLTLVAVVVNAVTLVVLLRYAWDTRIMTKQTKRQVDAMEENQLRQSYFRFYLSSDAFQMVQLELTALMAKVADFEGVPPPPIKPICPANWPEIAEGFLHGDLESGNAAMQLGIQLRNLDGAIHLYNECDYETRTDKGKALVKALMVSSEQGKKLIDAYNAHMNRRTASKA